MLKRMTFRKAKKTLLHWAGLFGKKKHKLCQPDRREITILLSQLKMAIDGREKKKAISLASSLDGLAKTKIKRNPFESFFALFFSIIFALAIAILIRQMWFEFYTIPSGSMRPTLKEQDYLVVSKTAYGINTPTRTGHIFFSPKLVQRGDIVIFSAEGLATDGDTTYFYLIPGKKQFVKRIIGKPGDRLYFYGGKIYGIDAMGDELKNLKNSFWTEKLEHIPFIRFEGKITKPALPIVGIYSPVILHQMNQPIAKLFTTPTGTLKGQMFPFPSRFTQPAAVQNYFDLWGFKHFSICRLMTKDDVTDYSSTPLPKTDKPVSLYLEIFHHPNLHPPILTEDRWGRKEPGIKTLSTILPLSDNTIKSLFSHMTTARFQVKGGYVYRQGFSATPQRTTPKMENVPDGWYEFQDGKAFQVKFGGHLFSLPKTHPLCSFSTKRVQLLYNLGIEWNLLFSPHSKGNTFLPSRYGYYKEENFYLLGKPIISKDDPFLITFTHKEYERGAQMNPISPYLPFEDLGPPLKDDGSLDKDFINHFGVHVPDGHYLMLGDNHAMSADSREFGFVPQKNIRGKALFLFWPLGKRFGTLSQPSTSWFTLPALMIYLCFALIASLLMWQWRRRKKKSLSSF